VKGKLQSEVSTLTYLLMSVVSSSNYRNDSPDWVLAVLANPMPAINCISIQIISKRCLFCDNLLLRDFWALCDNIYGYMCLLLQIFPSLLAGNLLVTYN
jgi:hypothetical protein